MELFAWSASEAAEFDKEQWKACMKLLRIPGRAPRDCIATLLDLAPCEVEWKVRRLGLFARLLNSPSHSWQHVALFAMS